MYICTKKYRVTALTACVGEVVQQVLVVKVAGIIFISLLKMYAEWDAAAQLIAVSTLDLFSEVH